jgi:hypothetical protein
MRPDHMPMPFMVLFHNYKCQFRRVSCVSLCLVVPRHDQPVCTLPQPSGSAFWPVVVFGYVVYQALWPIQAETGLYQSSRSQLACLCWFLAWFAFRPWRWRRYFPWKYRTTPELHGVTTQKTVLVSTLCLSQLHCFYELIFAGHLIPVCVCVYVCVCVRERERELV